MLLTKIVDMKIKKISDFKQINEESTVFVAIMMIHNFTFQKLRKQLLQVTGKICHKNL